MSNTEIKHLFKFNRFTENDYKIVWFVLYLPCAFLLVILRTILLFSIFVIGCTLPDIEVVQKVQNKIACFVLGITVTSDKANLRENVDVVVSNSVSIFDNIVVNSVTGAVAPSTKNAVFKSRGIGMHYFGPQSNLETFKKKLTDFIRETKTPVYFKPEGRITNGRGLLKFKTFPFQLSSRVQPVAVTITRPFFNIAVNVLGSTYWSDVICYMFSPLTNYHLKFLPVLEKKYETDEEFAEIARQNIAATLKIETTNFTAADMNEFEKRTLAEEERAMEHQARLLTSNNPEIERMTTQVKEVLPHVPYSAIYRDLVTTKSIDTTITNILDGRVRYVPEQVPSASRSTQPSPSATTTTNKPTTASSSNGSEPSFNTAASQFAKSASERSKSFQERKEQLIAAARKRYIEKHNLSIPV